MSFFVEKNTFLDWYTDPETLVGSNPDYYAPRFDAIKEVREQDDGSLHRGNEFRRVASLVNVPMLEAIKLVEPGFLKDKKTFYDWLDRGNNRAYCTYQRPSRAGRADQVVRDIGNLGKVFPLEAPAAVIPITEAI